MSRSLLHRLRIRLAGFLLRSPPDDPDRVLVNLCRDLTVAVQTLQSLLENDGRDTDEISGFAALADREAELIQKIVGLPARTLLGVVAKARGALLRPEVRGYDGALALSLSAAEDLARLAAGPEQPLSADLPFPRLARPDAAWAALLSDSETLKEQIMNNLFDADGRPPVRGRDIARGVTIGLLAELGAGAVVDGIALLAARPDLPRPFPAALVLVGFGAIALAVACLRRITRP